MALKAHNKKIYGPQKPIMLKRQDKLSIALTYIKKQDSIEAFINAKKMRIKGFLDKWLFGGLLVV